MNKMKKAIIFLLLSISVSISKAQLTVEWISYYEGQMFGLSSSGWSVETDDSMNVFVTGISDDGSAASSGDYFWDYVTIKYDSNGVFKWLRNFEGNAYHSATNHSRIMQLDDHSNVYLIARLSDLIFGQTPIIKYDNNGM